MKNRTDMISVLNTLVTAFMRALIAIVKDGIRLMNLSGRRTLNILRTLNMPNCPPEKLCDKTDRAVTKQST
jgi:hypothetical protein